MTRGLPTWFSTDSLAALDHDADAPAWMPYVLAQFAKALMVPSGTVLQGTPELYQATAIINGRSVAVKFPRPLTPFHFQLLVACFSVWDARGDVSISRIHTSYRELAGALGREWSGSLGRRIRAGLQELAATPLVVQVELTPRGSVSQQTPPKPTANWVSIPLLSILVPDDVAERDLELEFPRLWLDHAARGWLTWLDPATLMSLEGYALVLYADLCVRLMHSPATEQLTPDLVLAESEWAALLNEHDHGLVPAETKARRRAAVRALQTLERRGLIHPGAAIDRRSGHLRVRPTLLLSSLPVLTGLTAPAARRDRILFAHLRRLGFDTDRATRLLELSAERVHQALLYVAWRTIRDGQVTHVRQQREPIESPAKYVETAVRDAWEFGEPEFKRWLQSATSARHHVPQTQVLSLPTQAAGPDAFASDAVALETLIAAPGRPVDEPPEHATLRAALTAELGTAGPHLVPWVETARVGLLTPSMLLFVAPCSATGHPVLLAEADFLLLDSIVIRIAGVRLAPSTQFRAIARDGTLG